MTTTPTVRSARADAARVMLARARAALDRGDWYGARIEVEAFLSEVAMLKGWSR